MAARPTSRSAAPPATCASGSTAPPPDDGRLNAAELCELRTRTHTSDLPFIRALARAHGPRILELACGTGRVLRALVADGHAPVGVDVSAAAIEVARRRTPGLRLENQPMQELALGQQFDLVLIPFNSFELLQTAGDKRRTLDRIRAHGHAGTVLFIDTWPYGGTPEERAPEVPLHRIRTLSGPAGEAIEALFGARRTDEGRLSRSTMVYRWRDRDGREREVRDEFPVAPITADELRGMLDDSGFDVMGWYGDYERTPFDARVHSHLVVLARAGGPPETGRSRDDGTRPSASGGTP